MLFLKLKKFSKKIKISNNSIICNNTRTRNNYFWTTPSSVFQIKIMMIIVMKIFLKSIFRNRYRRVMKLIRVNIKSSNKQQIIWERAILEPISKKTIKLITIAITIITRFKIRMQKILKIRLFRSKLQFQRS